MTINRFPTFDDLRDSHREGRVAVGDEIIVDGVTFKFRKASEHPFRDMISNNKYGVVVYTAGAGSRKQQAKERGLDAWIVLLWKAFQNRMVPVGVANTSKQRGFMYEQEQNVIGDTAEVKFTNLPTTASLKGRVDTGATISSLHADSIQVRDGKVRFICKQLSPNVLTMDMADKQLVNSPDGGHEYRPVVELNVAINDKMLQGMQFNLNNRSQMEHPVLIGQNILEKGGFLINPMQEEVDWDALTETLDFEEFENIEPTDKEEHIKELLSRLEESDLSFSDIMEYMRTEAREVMETIEY